MLTQGNFKRFNILVNEFLGVFAVFREDGSILLVKYSGFSLISWSLN